MAPLVVLLIVFFAAGVASVGTANGPAAAVAVASLTVAAALIAIRALARQRARDAVQAGAADPVRAAVLLWREPVDYRPPDAHGLVTFAEMRPTLEVHAGTDADALLGRSRVEHALLPRERSLGPFALECGHWGVKLFDGRTSWFAVPLEKTRRATRAFRAAFARSVAEPAPLLEVGELPSVHFVTFRGVLFLAVAAALFVSVYLVVQKAPGAPIALTLALVAMGVLAVVVRARRREGLVQFFEHGIVFTRESDLRVGWQQLRGFDDSASDIVWLRGEGWASSEAVPTPTEADRLRVLELLDRRGVRRVER